MITNREEESREIDDSEFFLHPEKSTGLFYTEKTNMVYFTTNSKSNTLIISSLSIGNDNESVTDKEKRSQNPNYGHLNMFLDHICFEKKNFAFHKSR